MPIDPHQPQYLIAYGSLLETTSKKKTAQDVGRNYPVRVMGFKRGWFTRSEGPGPGVTYLSVVPASKASFNGAIFRALSSRAIADYDRREKYYCRISVPRMQIQLLSKHKLLAGQYWLYYSLPQKVQLPTPRFSITQSYVDLFLTGCFQLQDQYKLSSYARDCITTTTAWSRYWVNDRLFPRRPYVYQPNAGRIDRLLVRYLPEYFEQILIQ